MFFNTNLRKVVLESGDLKALIFFMKAGKEMEQARMFYSPGVPEYLFEEAINSAISYIRQVESRLDVAVMFNSDSIKENFDTAYAEWTQAAGALLTYSEISRICA